MTVGEAFKATSSGFTISYDPAGADNQVLVDIHNAEVDSSLLTGMTPVTITDLTIRKDGFQAGSVTVGSAGAVGLENLLSATSASLTLTNFGVTFGTAASPTPTVSGSVALTLSDLSLFPNGNFVQTTATSVTGAYSFAGFDGTTSSGQLTLTVKGWT